MTDTSYIFGWAFQIAFAAGCAGLIFQSWRETGLGLNGKSQGVTDPLDPIAGASTVTNGSANEPRRIQ